MKCYNTKLLKKAAKNSKYQAVKEILPSSQGQIKEQAKFTEKRKTDDKTEFDNSDAKNRNFESKRLDT